MLWLSISETATKGKRGNRTSLASVSTSQYFWTRVKHRRKITVFIRSLNYLTKMEYNTTITSKLDIYV